MKLLIRPGRIAARAGAGLGLTALCVLLATLRDGGVAPRRGGPPNAWPDALPEAWRERAGSPSRTTERDVWILEERVRVISSAPGPAGDSAAERVIVAFRRVGVPFRCASQSRVWRSDASGWSEVMLARARGGMWSPGAGGWAAAPDGYDLPIGPGIPLDWSVGGTLANACVWAALVWACESAIRQSRARSRVAEGRCAGCGHPVERGGQCPECGLTAPRSAPAMRRPPA